MQTLRRSLKTTFKQIRRGGWLTWASVAVMSMSFIVTLVFLALAFTLNLVLQSIENDPHIYIFYKPGTAELKVVDSKDDWEMLENIESIEYTSEEQALEEFKKYNQKANPITAEAIRQDVLPASLGIRLKKIDDAQEIIALVENEAENNSDVLSVGYSETVIENIKEIVNIVRIGGVVIIGMLVIVILLFTLLTTEFKIYYRSEEIGIMQLVGGGLWYIRLPFILESAIYGMMGAAIAVGILVGTYFLILQYYSQTELLKFINRFFGSLDWPAATQQDWISFFLMLIAIGASIGMINSYIAIRRYIK